MKIGIMGGTFNPIHLGHLILSEFIREEALLDKIIFIPTGHPPHKDSKIVLEGFHRKTMTELSIRDNPHFSLSNIELERTSTSYTIDTILELKKLYKDDKIFMIIGTDSLLEIQTWREYDKLLEEVEFLVALRPQQKKEEVIEEIRRLNLKYKINIRYIDTPLIDISSTEIRQRIKEGKSIKYLVKEDVNNYILENGLYL